LTSAASEPMPNLPTVKAMAPIAPRGASRITTPTMRKNSWPIWSMNDVTAATRCPSAAAAMPARIDTSSTCKMSPPENASPTVLGMMPSRKSVTPRCLLAVV